MTTVAVEPVESDKHRIPYERIVQWAAGPISIVAGAVAVWLDNHFGLLGKAGLGSDQTAKAIFDGLTFIVGAGLTYLSHAKWMTNLATWWTTQNDQGSIVVSEEQQIEQPAPEEEQEEESQTPFVEEPGYDEDGPGVEPDQPIEQDEAS